MVAVDLRAWFEANRGDLLAIAREDERPPVASWACPHAVDLDRWLVQQMAGHQTLRPGRPVVITSEEDLSAAPTGWGVYRIHRVHDDTWYVGISSNLRSRLRAHARNGMYDLDHGDSIELILAKDPGEAGVTTWSALQKAEERHIHKLKAAGKDVINVTAGGNGNPPRVRFNAQVQHHVDRVARLAPHARTVQVEIWHKVDAVTEEMIPGSEHPVLNLHMTWSDHAGDWKLHLDQGADHLMALAPGDGPIHPVGARTTIDIAWLEAKYAREHPGRSLRDDLDALSGKWAMPASGALRFYMHKRRLRDDAGRVQTDPAALSKVTKHDVTEASLPGQIRNNGFEVDPSFVQHNSINSIVRVSRPGTSEIYLKTEENQAAVRAEMLVSLLWHKLNWPGMGGRVTTSSDGVLLIPALGSGGIEDRGPFRKVFRHCPDETPATLQTNSPQAIKRIGLRDLALRDPFDVARFVVVNAVTGNTDRHKGNMHLGQRITEPAGANGYLLPLDHGRCILNNDRGIPRPVITGSPTETVRGDVGNPHQLLRPLYELTRDHRRQVLDTLSRMLGSMGVVLDDIHDDPAWTDYRLEVLMLVDRAAEIAADVDGFVDGCMEVVR